MKISAVMEPLSLALESMLFHLDFIRILTTAFLMKANPMVLDRAFELKVNPLAQFLTL